MATYYWDKQFRDASLPKAEKLTMVKAGVEAVDKALQLNAEYADAFVYKGLLLRSQANLESDPALAKRLHDEGSSSAIKARSSRRRRRRAGSSTGRPVRCAPLKRRTPRPPWAPCSPGPPIATPTGRLAPKPGGPFCLRRMLLGDQLGSALSSQLAAISVSLSHSANSWRLQRSVLRKR